MVFCLKKISAMKSKSYIWITNNSKSLFAHAPWNDEPYKTLTMLINNERHSSSLGHISWKRLQVRLLKKPCLTAFFIRINADVFNYCFRENVFVFPYLIYGRLMVEVFPYQIPFALKERNPFTVPIKVPLCFASWVSIKAGKSSENRH